MRRCYEHLCGPPCRASGTDRGPALVPSPNRVFVLGRGPVHDEGQFLAFYLNDMRTNKIHILFLYRKSDLCACGCRGWCSIHVLMHWLRWNVVALARGEMPFARHDNSVFQIVADAFRLTTRLGRKSISHNSKGKAHGGTALPLGAVRI